MIKYSALMIIHASYMLQIIETKLIERSPAENEEAVGKRDDNQEIPQKVMPRRLQPTRVEAVPSQVGTIIQLKILNDST